MKVTKANGTTSQTIQTSDNIRIIKQESFMQISYIVLSMLLTLFIQSIICHLSYSGKGSPGMNPEPAPGVY